MAIRIALIITALIFIFPQKVQANNSAQRLYFYSISEGEDCLEYAELNFTEDHTASQRAYALFGLLFSEPYNSYLPDDTRIIAANLVENTLIINVSDEILNYGGSYNERRVKELLLTNAFGIKGVDFVTLQIEGECGILPEGTIIHEEAKESSFETKNRV